MRLRVAAHSGDFRTLNSHCSSRLCSSVPHAIQNIMLHPDLAACTEHLLPLLESLQHGILRPCQIDHRDSDYNGRFAKSLLWTSNIFVSGELTSTSVKPKRRHRSLLAMLA